MTGEWTYLGIGQGGAAAEAPRGNLWPQNEAKLVMHVEMDTKSLQLSTKCVRMHKNTQLQVRKS